MNDADVIVVGGGPAGLSAALVLSRARHSVLVFDGGAPRNERSIAVHGFLTRDGVLPGELRRLAEADLEKYGVSVRRMRVLGARRDGDSFEARTAEQSFRAAKILLAMGMVDRIPAIAGLEPLYGVSVHQCPFCDGWEERDGALAACGSGDHAAAGAIALTNWSRDVVLFTHGGEAPGPLRRAELREHGIRVVEEPVASLEANEGKLQAIRLATGERVERSAMFLYFGQATPHTLITELGCELDPHQHGVLTDRRGRTSVPGVYAAGDIDFGPELAIVAAGEGATAAHALCGELRRERQRAAIPRKDSRSPP